MKYFLSFVEEAIMNPNFENWVGGRIEIYDGIQPYAIDEIRFLTDDAKAFEQLRESKDFQIVNSEGLNELKTTIRKYYQK